MANPTGSQPGDGIIGGRRTVMEALVSDVELVEIHLLTDTKWSDRERLLESAADRGVRIILTDRKQLNRLLPTVNHQGVVAYYRVPDFADLNSLLDKLTAVDPKPLLLLDGIEDPHNLGAIIRSAEALGAGGVIFRDRRAAGLTPGTLKSSAGSAFRLPLCVVTNIDRTIRKLREDSYWVFGLDSNADSEIWEVDLTGRATFVLGSEGRGLSELTRKRCDKLIRIPQASSPGSLNVSVAAGIILAEWKRQAVTSKTARSEIKS